MSLRKISNVFGDQQCRGFTVMIGSFIANIYISEKGTMIHHFVCVGHKILNSKKMVVLHTPLVAKMNLIFVKMTFMSRFQVLVY